MRIFTIGLVFFLCLSWTKSDSFINQQLKYERVRLAKNNHEISLIKQFKDQHISFPPQEVYLRTFKYDKEIEVWVKGSSHEKFKLFKTYDLCKTSGSLGPKRQEGDRQIPEGLYNLTEFNPISNFHLSMKINYPNASDQVFGKKGSLGGDIYIHGNCVTIGCLPLGDYHIEELYWLCINAYQNGATLPIHIFPFPLDDANITYFNKEDIFEYKLWYFWFQIKPAFDYFNKHHELPRYSILSNGMYDVKPL